MVSEYEGFVVDGEEQARPKLLRIAPLGAAQGNAERRLVYAGVLRLAPTADEGE